MDTLKHLVTIPISDYNELLEKSKTSADGFVQIKAESQHGRAIQEAFETMNRMNGMDRSGDIFKHHDFFVKSKQ